MKSRNVTLNCGTAEGSVRADRSGRRFVAPALMLFALGLSALLTGCAASFDPKLSGAEPSTSIGSLKGKAHGGQAPIYGAAVYIMQTGLSGYPGSSVAANTSLIASGTGTFTGTVNGTSHGTYVLTDFNGNFTINGFTCTPGAGVYLYAVGGQPIAGTTNNASTEMAAMGICPAGGASALAASVPYVNINEVSTAAMAYALEGFTATGYDATHISSSVTNSVGLTTAFANAALLYSVGTNNGANSVSPVDPTHFSMIDYQKLNTMANILADCINSNGSTASNTTPCYILFQNATSNGTSGSGTIPTDTAAAMINITHNVQSNISNLYALASNSYAPYAPALSSAPNDFTYSVRYTNANDFQPQQLAIDSAGTIYALGCNSAGCNTSSSNYYVTKISPLTGTIGSSAGIADQPIMAIDQSNNAFLYDNKTGLVSEYGASTTAALGTAASGSPFNFSSKLTSSTILSWLNNQAFIIGPTNNLEIANFGASTPNVVNFPLSSGTYSATNSNVIHTTQNSSPTRAIAVDGTGTTWFANGLGAGNANSNIAATVTSGGTYTTLSLPGANSTYAGFSLALDALGNAVFASDVPNNGSIDMFTQLTPTGGIGYTSVTNAGMNYPQLPVLDGLDNMWFANCSAGAGNGLGGISRVQPTATTSNPTNYTNADGFYLNSYSGQLGVEGTSSTTGAASCQLIVDGAGDVLVDVSGTAGVLQGFVNYFIGVGAPTIQPLSLMTLKLLPTNTSYDIRP